MKLDPTSKFQKEIKDTIKQSNLVIDNTNNKLINPNPSAPKLRVSIKIHKENYPIEPIVNYIPAPAYRLKKQLVKILQNKLIINNKYNIKNATNLTEILSKIDISSDSKLISLDIKDMYTNIPIQETLNIIDQHLQNLQYHPLEIQKIINLLDNSLKQNYFQYNNEFYIQKMVSLWEALYPQLFPKYSYSIGKLKLLKI